MMCHSGVASVSIQLKESVNSSEPPSDSSRYLADPADFGSDRYFLAAELPDPARVASSPYPALLGCEIGVHAIPACRWYLSPLSVSRTPMVRVAVVVVGCRCNAQSNDGLFLMYCPVRPSISVRGEGKDD